MKHLLALLVLTSCAIPTVAGPNGLRGYTISCQPMSNCLILASEHCTGPKGFTMNVQEGTQSGPTVDAWQPSSDGYFHLFVSCN